MLCYSIAFFPDLIDKADFLTFLCREFFHLLCLEFINPQYALFQCVNGLYRPNPNSSINPSHLFYFNFFGKLLAKTVCDGTYLVA